MASRRVNGYGVVKAVSSGDTIVLMGAPKVRGEMPPERTIILTGINAPRFARGKTSVDEPWAWEARELIRKKAIGQQVSFNVQHSAGDRDYGNVYVGDENLSHSLLKSGFANLKDLPEGAKPTVEREGLMAIEAEAKAAGAGMWAKGADKDAHVRNVDFAPKADKVYDKFHGKPVNAVVSQLRNGSALRCEVQGSVSGKAGANSFMILTVTLAGATCPRVPFKNKTDDTKEEPEPFAMEANHWVEARLLHRDVQIVIRGVDKTDNLYGEILFPKGDVTVKLLELGLATYTPWTAHMSPNAAQYETAAAVARAKKLRLGATAAEPPKTEEMFGTVNFIQSGDTVRFTNDADQQEHTFSIASIRTQRPARRGEASTEQNAYCWDAKEFLRSRLIGKKVRAVVEYRRTVGSDTDRMFGSLFVKDLNMGIGLVSAGFAECVRHKWDDPHSMSYGALMTAERAAINTSTGMHGKKGGTPVIDLTDRPRKGEEGEEAKMTALAAKGYNHMLSLKKKKAVSAVVEYAFTGGRFKLYIPDEKILVSFNLSGIRTPGTKDPFGPEALEFSRNLTLQKTVRIEVENCDKSCTFVGNMFVSNSNLGTQLLTNGLASVFGPSADRSPYCDELYNAEEVAREAKLNIWKNYVEPVVVEGEGGEDSEEMAKKGFRDGAGMEVKITEITDATTFYINRVDDANVHKVEAFMEQFNAAPPEQDDTFEPKKGSIVAGLFEDGLWYRVRLEGITAGGEWRVMFVDFGNSDLLQWANLREMSDEGSKLPPSAKACFLAGLRAPTKSSEHFEDAAATFHELAFDRILCAKVECVDKSNKLHLTLTPRKEDVEDKTDTTSINQILVREGWARLLDRPEFKLKELVKSLRGDEEIAKLARCNIWEYGDVSDEEEDDGIDPNKKRFDGRPPGTGKSIITGGKK